MSLVSLSLICADKITAHSTFAFKFQFVIKKVVAWETAYFKIYLIKPSPRPDFNNFFYP